MGKEIRLADRSLTLRLRRDAFVRYADKQRAADATKAFLADAFVWSRDDALMRELCGLLGLDSETAADAMFKVRRAIETGDIVAIPDPPRYTGAGSSGSSNPKPRVATFTPSQLFKGASRLACAASYSAGLARLRMPPNDWLAKWQANPGDVLPDGSIATALNSSRGEAAVAVDDGAGDISALADDAGEPTLLSDAQPFDYAPDAIGDAEQDVGVFLTPAEEAECEMQYEADMAECGAYAAMNRSAWSVCKERAMNRYAYCLRGMG
ncbi:hypothetical protein ACFQ3P_14800 [Paraburkholderia sabiae]|uniref:Uncharacterized protein n=1 Tax=Paraburkholderia sabiae TaxID=273251 RepID=A0ABU9Q878_9BURK|nr:hypothetical protein [Paraburkholderia sabiae]WJZ77773.1 hypothetical protein QEN71_37660 [Paraburkholderia sabiae]CAD6532476.1 hypothetical protein LMG24235_02630 [Paraburkholderia sabiae]